MCAGRERAERERERADGSLFHHGHGRRERRVGVCKKTHRSRPRSHSRRFLFRPACARHHCSASLPPQCRRPSRQPGATHACHASLPPFFFLVGVQEQRSPDRAAPALTTRLSPPLPPLPTGWPRRRRGGAWPTLSGVCVCVCAACGGSVGVRWKLEHSGEGRCPIGRAGRAPSHTPLPSPSSHDTSSPHPTQCTSSRTPPRPPRRPPAHPRALRRRGGRGGREVRERERQRERVE